MKIKTITCHEVYNYGATLQAYALMKYLQKLGHHVEIINYKPDFLSYRYNLFELSPRFSQNLLVKFAYLCVKVPMRLSESTRKRKYAFDKFTRNYLNITRVRYKNYDELKANPPDADIFFCGSDQIWNTMEKAGRDAAFYLDFAPQDSIRASYAASFGTDSIFAGYEEFVKTKTDSLDKISVRETKGLEILKGLGINRGTHVMDPVFLLENEEWLNIAAKSFNQKYILVYDFENNPLIEACAKKLSKEKKLEIYSINDWIENPYADVNIQDAGPDKFLSLIINSEVFLSNSFHGTAYCLIFKKNFYVFNRIKQNVNSRMTDLLGQLNLSNRLISEIKYMKNDSIDFSTVSLKLDALVKQSKDYIKSVLEHTK